MFVGSINGYMPHISRNKIFMLWCLLPPSDELHAPSMYALSWCKPVISLSLHVTPKENIGDFLVVLDSPTPP